MHKATSRGYLPLLFWFLAVFTPLLLMALLFSCATAEAAELSNMPETARSGDGLETKAANVGASRLVASAVDDEEDYSDDSWDYGYDDTYDY